MQFKEKIYGKIHDVKCDNFVKRSVKGRQKKKVICGSKEFSMLGKCVPKTEDERAMLNGSQLIKLECVRCKNSIWKLCEKSPDGKAN